MNTLTETTNPTTADTAVEAPRREPMGRVVVGSVAAGLVGALILTVGVFGGATEPVITGSALIAFAGGWALLAVLSSHFTSQPQTWARVPAIAMATVGAALMIARPGDHVLNASGWVWPLAAIALGVWMFVQLRRNLHGRARVVLYPVVAAIIVCSIGGAFATVTRAEQSSTYPAPGRLYDVGGHRLHLDCVGSGSPTVVIENGLGGMSALWSRITGEVGRTTRVCTYDRAGQGWSDDVGRPQDGHAVAADLHTLLQRAGEAGPYVLVGHSAGGVYTMIYAAQYPDDVAGVVLLDSMTPNQFTALPDYPSQYSMMRRGVALLPSVARLGIARVLPSSAWSSLPEPAASQVAAFSSDPRQFRSMRDELSEYHTVMHQAQALTTLGNKPLVVVTASESLRKTKGWSDEQNRLAELSTDSQHRVVDSTHEGVVDDAHSYETSVQAIDDVARAVRSGRPLAARIEHVEQRVG
jgi:pimeloyl-ACP methyl ester carboxylesterase